MEGVKKMKLTVDLHTHTIASGHAYSSLLEMIQGAKNNNIEVLATTDHGPMMPGGPHLYHFGNMKAIPKEIDGVTILKGVEANITDYDGSLDMPTRYLKTLDIVLAGFHNFCYPGSNVEENTNSLINAMKNPFVDIIVHPGNPDYPINIEKFVSAAIEYNVLVEINNSSFSVSRRGSTKNCLEIAKTVNRLNGMVSFGSDAHIYLDVGNFNHSNEYAKKAGLDKNQIINSSSEAVLKFLTRDRSDYRNRVYPKI